MPSNFTTIQKHAHASDGNSTDQGDLTAARKGGHGHSSATHGYMSGGYNENIIDKWLFATGANATDVGNLLGNHGSGSGTSSSTHGYVGGIGYINTTQSFSEVIQKFSFTSDGNSTDVANLYLARGVGSANAPQV